MRAQCCHCRGEQLIRSPGLREVRRPPRASSSPPFRVPVVTKTTITTYDKDDDSEGVMRQGILSLLWLASWLDGWLTGWLAGWLAGQLARVGWLAGWLELAGWLAS